MDITKLSERTIEICKNNYDDNCGKCELRSACVQNCGAGAEKLNHWVQELNKLATE